MIIPDWPAPKHIVAFTTTIKNGNLATHVGDDRERVLHNRSRLVQEMHLPREPIWLTQTHSTTAALLTSASPPVIETPADASFTQESNLPCAVLTADCLPLLVCNESGTEIAAIHAGWRGLLAGVIQETITQLSSAPATLLVWLGPAIGPQAFQVDDTIRLDFINRYPHNEEAFQPMGSGWLADLYKLAKISLEAVGVSRIYGGEYCTVTDKQFFSHRRDQEHAGRMASVICRLSER